MRPISVSMPVAVTIALPCPYVAAVPLKIMLSRSPSGTSSEIRLDALGDGQALARQCRLPRSEARRLDEPRISWNGVAFLNKNDVAGHDGGRVDRASFAIAHDDRVGG
jgi:hypothetical protein